MRILIATLALLCSLGLEARTTTGAPGLRIAGEVGAVETLPLVMTRVDATLVAGIADVVVTQQYENRGSETIEAVYAFPASERAAVYALTMKIGDRVVRAEIAEKEKARETYEEAKESGKTASLLEARDVDVFQMNVANIRPGDRIDVELRYTERLVPTAGVYEFFYPNTVGVERYMRGPDDLGGASPKSSRAPEVGAFSFDLRARILAPFPINSIESTSHEVAVSQATPGEAVVQLSDRETQAGAKDFRLHYTLRGAAVQEGLLIYPGKDENFFLLTLQPPARVDLDVVPPREFLYVVDVSGSMGGQPIKVAKDLMGEMLLAMRPEDRFNVIQFAGGAGVLYAKGSVAASDERLLEAKRWVDHAQAGGGTELVPALEAAYALPRDPAMARSIVVITDGGIAAGLDSSQLIRSHLNQANLFMFGVGGYLDRGIIRRLARAGQGEPAEVSDFSQAGAATEKFRKHVERPLLTGISLEFQGFDAYDVQPAQQADLLAERPLVVVGKYRGPMTGRVLVKGRQGARPYQAALELSQARADQRLGALRSLWARERLDQLYDDRAASWNQGMEKEITGLGLKYSLLTPYTSFVAVSQEVRGPAGETTVEQPVAKRRPANVVAGGSGYGAATAPVSVAARPAPKYVPEDFERGPRTAARSQPKVVSEAAPGPLESTETVTQTTTLASARSPSSAAPPPPPVPQDRTVGSRTFRLVDDVWTDLAAMSDASVLRIKRGTKAYDDLLALRPELKEAMALGEKVLVAFGKYSILIGPDGFSTYPHAQLEKAVRGRR